MSGADAQRDRRCLPNGPTVLEGVASPQEQTSALKKDVVQERPERIGEVEHTITPPMEIMAICLALS